MIIIFTLSKEPRPLHPFSRSPVREHPGPPLSCWIYPGRALQSAQAIARSTAADEFVAACESDSESGGPYAAIKTEGRGRFGPADRPSARTLGIPYQHQGREECKIN